jgi:hypothetical protein
VDSKWNYFTLYLDYIHCRIITRLAYISQPKAGYRPFTCVYVGVCMYMGIYVGVEKPTRIWL